MQSFNTSKFPSFVTVKIFLFWIVLFLPYLASAQTDKEFWFVAPYVFDAGRDFDKPINLRITTAASTANVVISMPADPTFTPISRTINPNSTISVDLTTWIAKLQSTPANTVLNKGLLITSTADITAYYEVVSSFCNCNPEIFSLKGKNALGTEFFISSQYTYDESTAYSGASNSFDIVATKNSTNVTITPSKNIVGHSANVPFTIVLNAGQTYSAVASSSSASGHLQGSYITADNPVAITLKDDLVQVSSCADLVGDQTVPTSVLGTEYIVTKGFLQSADNIYITAVADGTSIFIDGSATPLTVLAKGGSTMLSLSNPSTYIRSSKNIYVYQFTGNGCEAGSAIIPKINCTGSQSVSIVRSKTDLFAVMITTKNGNQGNFTVNGSGNIIKSSDFAAVPGTGGAYVTSRIDLTGYATVGTALNFTNSTGNFSLGFINGGTNNGTIYGFFSDFKSSNVEKSSLEICPAGSAQLLAYGGVSYQWSPATGLSNSNIANPVASPTVTTDYKVTITTAEGCVDFATVNVKVLNVIIPSVSIAASATNVCVGTLVTYTATPVNGGTTPNYRWQVNGINVGTNSATFSSTTLGNGDKVSCIMTSNAACAAPVSISSNVVTMNVDNNNPVSVSISTSANNICQGAVVTFTATPVNGGPLPSYQWQVNGINTGTNSANFTINTLANGDKVICILTGVSGCSLPVSTASNTITMSVNPALTPSVGIVASANNICMGTAVTFSATSTNGGTAPIYQWQVNSVNAGTNSPTFTSSDLTNGDILTCQITSNALCATPITASSNAISMVINAYVNPSVNISASANNICPGDAITFTATPGNGGVSPVYQWRINGFNVGTDSPVFTSSSFVNGDVVSCFIISNSTCVTPVTATSNNIIVSVNPPVSPSVIIAASINNICPGTLITFTATPVNGGSLPIYQWQVNGKNAGSNSVNFSTATLVNGDKVSCILTSNAACAVPTNVTSNSITINVSASQPASVSITASQNNICVGTAVTFTATPVNGGAAPFYQWQVNGINAGNNSPIFSSGAFINGDNIKCVLTSNALCATPSLTISNVVSMVVNAYTTPSVSVTSSGNNSCPGDAITFTATPLNGSTTPFYQWKINGVNAGANNPVFASDAFVNGDIVSCVITSNSTCITAATATSNNITVSINPAVSPLVSIAVSNNNICPGTGVTFTATPINGGNNPVYQWIINGANAGTNSNTFVSSKLTNNDVVICQLTSNAPCVIPVSVTSNSITMIVNPLPVISGGGDKSIDRGNSTVLNATASGIVANVIWSPAEGLNDPKILSPTASPDKTTLYTLTAQSTAGCVIVTTMKVTVLNPLGIPNTFTPNGDGINDKWEIKNLIVYPNATVKIFSRWGQEVYSTLGYAKAWDGTKNGKPLPFGVYYYIINLNNNTKPISGSLTIVR